MSGGYYRPKGRKYFTVWYPVKGEKILIRKALDGGKIYHEKQAERVLEKIRGEVDAEIFDPSIYGKDKVLLIENAWEDYQAHAKAKKNRIKKREQVFRDYIHPYFEKKSIREIRTIDVQHWDTEISKLQKAPATHKVYKSVFRGFLWYHSDSLTKMPKFPNVSVPKKSKPWLTQDEQEKHFEFILPHHHGIFRFLMTYGPRSSESCTFKRTDIDWGKRIFTLRDRKANDENTLPILPEIEKYLSVKVSNLIYVFSNKNGRPYFRQGLYNIWKKANRKAHSKYGIKIISLKNATRHSLASQLANKGKSLTVIARILGNSEHVVEENYGSISTNTVAQVIGENVTILRPISEGSNKG